MRVLFEMNRLYGSVVVLSLLCFSSPIWGQDETGIKVVVHRESTSDADIIKAHADIRQKLSKKIDLTFQDIELGAALNEIAAKLDVPLYFDPVGLEEAAVTKDQVITFKLKGVSAKSALRLFLKSLNLIYEIDHETLIITSQEKAAEKQTFKVYDCRDLLELVPKVVSPPDRPQHIPGGGMGGVSSGVGGPNSEVVKPTPTTETLQKVTAEARQMVLNDAEMIKLIERTIDVGNWINDGGKGTIESFGGLIVINQTEQGHDEIERLLSTMRELVKKTPTKEKP